MAKLSRSNKALMSEFLDAAKVDPLKPSLPLLCKLGSIAVHVEEMLSTKGHELDRAALQTLLDDADVRGWIKSMGVYMPVKR